MNADMPSNATPTYGLQLCNFLGTFHLPLPRPACVESQAGMTVEWVASPSLRARQAVSAFHKAVSCWLISGGQLLTEVEAPAARSAVELTGTNPND